MRVVDGLKQVLSRRDVSAAIGLASFQFVLGVRTMAAETPASQFDYLSMHGNSSCTKEFLDSISIATSYWTRSGALRPSPRTA